MNLGKKNHIKGIGRVAKGGNRDIIKETSLCFFFFWLPGAKKLQEKGWISLRNLESRGPQPVLEHTVRSVLSPQAVRSPTLQVPIAKTEARDKQGLALCRSHLPVLPVEVGEP